MKSCLIFPFFIAFFISGYSQHYVPMIGNSNEWYLFQEAEFGSNTKISRATHDTLVDGLKYKIIESNQPSYYEGDYEGLLREDTLNRIVYFRYLANSTIFDTLDKILYDFGKAVGDTVWVQSWGNGIPYFFGAKIDSIVSDPSVSINEIFYLHVVNVTHARHLKWVVGVGSVTGLFDNIPTCSCNLLCAFKDSMQTFHEKYSPLGGLLDTCEISYSGISSVRVSNLPVYPNPVEGWVDFDIDGGEAFDITIYNTQAQPVFDKKDCKLPVDVMALKPGLYFIKCETNTNTALGKFVKL